MSENLLQRNRNILEQQKHNRRMTIVFIILFVGLIIFLGVGFDFLFNVSSPIRFILLPLLLISLLFTFRNHQEKMASSLWNKNKSTGIDTSDNYVSAISKLLVGSFLIIYAMVAYRLDPKFFEHLVPSFLDTPLLRAIPFGAILMGVIGIAFIWSTLYSGQLSILLAVNAELAESDTNNIQYNELNNVVTEISLAAGIPKPTVYIIHDGDPNALATGSIEESSIIVTTGLLSILTREELQGVIAHEISHIRNNDTYFLTVVTVLFGTILLLSEWIRKSFLWGSSGTRVPGMNPLFRILFFVVWCFIVLFSPIIARILAMSVSRQREFLADASAAQLTRNPLALAKALGKIEARNSPTFSIPKSIAHMCVIDPLGRKINNKEGFWSNLFATHPPIQKRITLLRAMSYQ